MRDFRLKLIAIITLITFLMPSATLAETLANSKDRADAIKANCGALALAEILDHSGRSHAAAVVRQLVPNSRLGFNMYDLQSIAQIYGLTLTPTRVAPQSWFALPLPAIVHREGVDKRYTGHFAVLAGIDRIKDRFHIYDPQSRRRYSIDRPQFESEWNDIALVHVYDANLLGQKVSKQKAKNVVGGDNEFCGGPSGGGNGGGCKDGQCCGAPGGPGGGNGCSSGKCAFGAPSWWVNMINLNLVVEDIPLWYDPPLGPSVHFQITYNAEFPSSGPQVVGNKWSLSYCTHLEEDSGTGDVLVYMPDGAQDLYEPDGAGGYVHPYKVYSTLTKLTDDHFELRFPDDRVYVYQLPPGSSALFPMLTRIRDAYGHSLNFTYNSSAQLTTITDALGRDTILTFSNGQITRVDDPFGRHAEFQYESNGDLKRIVDMGGYWTDLTYDADSYIASLTDATSTTGFYIEPRNPNQTTSDWFPPPGGNMFEHYRITVTHPDGNKSQYFYSGYTVSGWYVSPNNYIEYVDGSNHNASEQVPKRFYHYEDTVKGIREEVGGIATPEGIQTTDIIDYETGRVTSRTDGDDQTIEYEYNSMGEMNSITRELGVPTSYEYDPDNLIDLIKIERPGLGFIDIDYNGFHQVTDYKDFNGNLAHYEYNANGQLETVTVTVDGTPIITRYNYYDVGESSPYQLKETLRNGQIIAQYTYDSVGRVQTVTDATDMTITYQYNDLDKVTRVIYPDEKYEETIYAPCCPFLPESFRDRSGRATNYTYDASKRLKRIEYPDGTDIQYAYDANGNRTQIIDANGQITQFEYDLDNRLVKKTFADGNATSFHYTDNSLLKRRIDARGIETEYQYDANNRLIDVHYSDGTRTVSYHYDDFGRIQRMTDGTGVTRYTYNANSMVRTVDGPWDNDTITYDYDALNRRIGISPQMGKSATFHYDTMHRLEEVHSETNVFTYVYPNSRSPLVDRLTRPNGSYTSYGYDGLNRLISVENKTVSDTLISSNHLPRSDQDLIETETTNTNDSFAGFQQGLTAYNHNYLNQLESTTNPSQSFNYDAEGNMTSGVTLEGYMFIAAYDGENRLKWIEYTDSSDVVWRNEFEYNGYGVLSNLKRYRDGSLESETRLVSDGFNVLQERDGSNTIVRQYTWGIGKRGGIGSLLNLHQDAQDYYYLYDGKGNVTAVIDNTQAVVASYFYDSFGRLMEKSVTLDQPYQFSTKRYFADVGLDYYGYRFYNPSIGRWMTRDPLWEAGGINLYQFVDNNPVHYVDPLGENTIAIGGGIGVVVGGPPGAAIGAAIGAGIGLGLGLLLFYGPPDPCDDDDFCYDREDQERKRCSNWESYKDWGAVQGCLQRAAIRRDMCVRNGGAPHPDEPPEWSTDDIF